MRSGRPTPSTLASSFAAAAATVLASAGNAAAQERAPDKDACAAAYETGQARRDEGKLLEARASLAVCASESCPKVLRGDCIQWLREVDARLPSIVVRVVGADGSDVADATVSIDGGPALALDGRAIPLDPGAHTVRGVAAKGELNERVVLAEGETSRAVILRFDAPSAPAPPPAVAVTAPAPLPPTPDWVYVLGGVGAAAIGVGGFFYLAGFSDGSDLVDHCGSPPRCRQEDVDAVHEKLVIGDVLAGVGLVAVGVATYFALAPRFRRQAAWVRPHGIAF